MNLKPEMNNKFNVLDSDNDSDNDNHNNSSNNHSQIKSNTIVDINANTNVKIIDEKKLKQPEKNIVNKVEDEVFNQYYGKKMVNKNYKNNKFNNQENYYNNHTTQYNQPYKSYQNNQPYQNNHTNQYHQPYQTHDNFKDEYSKPFNNTNNNFIKVGSKKYNNKDTIECTYKKIEPDFFELSMSNYFRVLAHHSNDKSWDYNSYHNITTLRKWKDLGTFFKTLNTISGECSYTDFDIFIMKNEISPMWEDTENRNGSICSIKIDSLTDGYEILKNLTIHMANNTLLKFNPSNWDTINGISFSSKKIDNITETYCVVLKIWFKINILNYGTVDKIIIEKIINDDINNSILKYSIKCRIIKPEY